MGRPVAGFVALASLAAAWAGVGCDTGFSGVAQRTFTSTIAPGNQSQVLVETFMPIEIRGEPRLDEILVTVEATLTASTTTVAQMKADELDVEVDDTSTEQLVLRLPRPANAQLTGKMSIRLPSRFRLDARANEGTIVVSDMDSSVQVAAVSGVRVENVDGDVLALVTRGNVLISTRLVPGQKIEAQTGNGNIELGLPEALSADVTASTGQGEVIIGHPRLPAAVGPGRTNYAAQVNGGLSIIRALTQAGVIVIGLRD